MRPEHRTTGAGVLASMAVGVLVLPAMLVLAGCGSTPPTQGPTGVDGLVIPTPSPDPGDFVAAVDNPLLPLEAGSSWTYQVVGGGRRTVTSTVLPSTRPVGGLDATVLRETAIDADGRALPPTERLYAQDADGNVWLVRADGEAAGLAMPAAPRIGDGFERGVDGLDEDRVTVLGLDASVTVPLGELDGLVEVEVLDGDAAGTTRELYAPGLGLVLAESSSGDGLSLVSFVDG